MTPEPHDRVTALTGAHAGQTGEVTEVTEVDGTFVVAVTFANGEETLTDEEFTM